MSSRLGKVRDADRDAAKKRLEDAQNFMRQAELTADSNLPNSRDQVASSYILAAIAAADALCAHHLRKIGSGAHDEGPKLLRQITPGGADLASDLMKALNVKSVAQYQT